MQPDCAKSVINVFCCGSLPLPQFLEFSLSSCCTPLENTADLKVSTPPLGLPQHVTSAAYDTSRHRWDAAHSDGGGGGGDTFTMKCIKERQQQQGRAVNPFFLSRGTEEGRKMMEENQLHITQSRKEKGPWKQPSTRTIHERRSLMEHKRMNVASKMLHNHTTLVVRTGEKPQ